MNDVANLIRRWHQKAEDLCPDTQEYKRFPQESEVKEAASQAYEACAAELGQVLKNMEVCDVGAFAEAARNDSADVSER